MKTKGSQLSERFKNSIGWVFCGNNLMIILTGPIQNVFYFRGVIIIIVTNIVTYTCCGGGVGWRMAPNYFLSDLNLTHELNPG